MTKLILIRHGRTLWNSSGKFQGQSDIELSQEGISQAEKLAENFPVTHIDRVYSSNLKRAYITGEIIAKKFNVPIIKDKRLCEVSFGSWEGLTYDEIHENILDGVNIGGANFIILMCAIIIASVGLNMNATAVIIGAMLISPLMGPIIAIGYSVGIYNLKLLKKSAIIFSIYHSKNIDILL